MTYEEFKRKNPKMLKAINQCLEWMEEAPPKYKKTRKKDRPGKPAHKENTGRHVIKSGKGKIQALVEKK
jgi:hypothetical protein